MRFVVFSFIVSVCLIYVILITISSNSNYLELNRTSPRYVKSTFIANDNSYTKIEYSTNHVVEKDEESFLILSSVLNSECYREGRSFDDLFSALKSIYKDRHSSVSLGFLVGTQNEFEVVNKYIEDMYNAIEERHESYNIDRVTLIIAPFIESVYDTIALTDRHDESLQRVRRKKIARSRNFLLSNALKDETYTIFVDADIKKIPPTLINEFIKSEKDIIVPRITQGKNKDYDLNSWSGSRSKPTEEQLKYLNDNDLENYDFIPKDLPDKVVHLGSFAPKKKKEMSQRNKFPDDYLVKLDSVGGAFLFAKSKIYKQGVVFPPFYVVGTDWERIEGYDGVETEGLCYVARSIGYECWGMPNQVVLHAL